jgi:hypothetical protein
LARFALPPPPHLRFLGAPVISPDGTLVVFPAGEGTTASQGQNIGFVEGNHAAPHVAIISAAQLSAGDGVILDMSNGFHSHTVTLTGAQVREIATKGHVYVDSSINPHSSGADTHAHGVTFN